MTYQYQYFQISIVFAMCAVLVVRRRCVLAAGIALEGHRVDSAAHVVTTAGDEPSIAAGHLPVRCQSGERLQVGRVEHALLSGGIVHIRKEVREQQRIGALEGCRWGALPAGGQLLLELHLLRLGLLGVGTELLLALLDLLGQQESVE